MKSHDYAVRIMGADANFHNTVFASLFQPCAWCLIETIIKDALKAKR